MDILWKADGYAHILEHMALNQCQRLRKPYNQPFQDLNTTKEQNQITKLTNDKLQTPELFMVD